MDITDRFKERYTTHVVSVEPLFSRCVLKGNDLVDRLRNAKSDTLKTLGEPGINRVIIDKPDFKEAFYIAILNTQLEHFGMGGILHKLNYNINAIGEGVKVHHVGSVNQNFGNIIQSLAKNQERIMGDVSSTRNFYEKRMPGTELTTEEFSENNLWGELIMALDTEDGRKYMVFPNQSNTLSPGFITSQEKLFQRSNLTQFCGYSLSEGQFGDVALDLLNGNVHGRLPYTSLILTDYENVMSFARDLKLSSVDLLIGQPESLDIFGDGLEDIVSKMGQGNAISISEKGVEVSGNPTQSWNELLDSYFSELKEQGIKLDSQKINDKKELLLGSEIKNNLTHLKDAFGITGYFLAQKLPIEEAVKRANSIVWNAAYLNMDNDGPLKTNFTGKLSDNFDQEFAMPSRGLMYDQEGLIHEHYLVQTAREDILNNHSPQVGRIYIKNADNAAKLLGEPKYVNTMENIISKIHEVRDNVVKNTQLADRDIMFSQQGNTFLFYIAGDVRRRLNVRNNLQSEIEKKIQPFVRSEYKGVKGVDLKFECQPINDEKTLDSYIRFNAKP